MSTTSQFPAILAAAVAAREAELRQAYACGRLDEREHIARLLRSASSEAAAVLPLSPSAAAQSDPHATAVGRVAPGTIRPLVQQVLRAEPGLTKSEIARRVAALGHGIASSSISNELQRNEDVKRNKNRLYRQWRGKWSLVEELPETEGPATADDDRPAGSVLNGSHPDERSIEATSGPGE
jgi:hypothetical protein